MLHVSVRWEIVRHVAEAVKMSDYQKQTSAMPTVLGLGRQVGRVRIAFILSVVLNVFLFVVSLSINPSRKGSTSETARVLDVLSAPSTAFAEWIAPRGHGGAHFVVALIAAIVSSVVFYAALAWVVLSLPIWWRHRT
jgi:hypothetical protein